MRLLCDEMLQRLCRWLRAAGYDAALPAPGAADKDVFQQALAHDRLLLTRDRGFLDRREARSRVFYFETTEIDAQARLLRDELGIDWLREPFSRCLLCNTPLERVEERERPPKAVGALLRCPGCDKVFWEGSHVQRMRSRLACWASGRQPPLTER